MDKDITKFVYEDFATFKDEDHEDVRKPILGKEDTISIQDLEIIENEEGDIDQKVGDVTEVQEEVKEEVKEELIPESKDKYQEGYDAAKAELDPLLQQKQQDDLIYNQLHQKISAIEINDDFQKEILLQMSEIVKTSLEHLRKTLPTDFESIFQEKLFPVIKKGMKAGVVNINIHPSQKNIVTELIAKNVTENISQIKLLEDDNLNTDDIKVECHNASFEYKSDDIISAIDKMVSKDKN